MLTIQCYVTSKQKKVVDEQYHLRLCDFGLARISLKGLGIVIQPEHTMNVLCVSPEQYEQLSNHSKYNYTEESAVYNLGMILFELFTRTRYSDVASLNDLHQGTRPALPQSVHPDVQHIIEHCWCQLPDDRWTVGEIMARFQQIKEQLLAMDSSG